ncbi:hypothetical protein [Glaesserella parasuis]|uniref:hypothetical protein n=1 Tax=Glaesserella parasuis TaxID=738 RepID=UPI00138FDDE0|nr:hypothetical protein [Glaesserella parasuis]
MAQFLKAYGCLRKKRQLKTMRGRGEGARSVRFVPCCKNFSGCYLLKKKKAA